MPIKSEPGAGAPRRLSREQASREGSSNVRAPVTPGELRELIEETALLRARRRGRRRWTASEWAEAEAEVQRRLGRP